MAELGAGPPHDRKAEPHALRSALAHRALELVEDAGTVGLADPRAGVVHLEPDPFAAPPHAHDHAPGLGVFQRVRDEVLGDAAQKGRVAVHHRRGRHEAEPQPRRLGHRRVFDRQPLEQLVQRHRTAVKLDPLAVQPADVEDGVHQLLDRLEGPGEARRQLALHRVEVAVGQRRQIQPRGGQRLQQVMACRTQEPGLGAVGLIGRRAGHGEVAVALRQVRERRLEIAGAGQRLLFQRDGGLKGGPGRAARLLQPVHAVDQRLDDAGQLVGAARGVGVVGQHHGTSAGGISARPTKVWLTCIPPCCSP